jgi:hypothetical protein
MRGPGHSLFFLTLFPFSLKELPCKSEIGKLLNNLKMSHPIPGDNYQDLPSQLKNKFPASPPREFLE